MNCVILACSSLTPYVCAAQEKLGTAYPEVYLDKVLHADPPAMRQRILDTLATLPETCDTVLVAMGYCGGSWKDVVAEQTRIAREAGKTPRTFVWPVADDCVSLLLHTAERQGYNLKERGHLYLKDPEPTEFDIARAYEQYTAGMDPQTRTKIREAWQANYTVIDVVDTGLTQCDTPAYRAWAEKNAAWIDGRVERLQGSNLLIEKLIGGDWDPTLFTVE